MSRITNRTIHAVYLIFAGWIRLFIWNKPYHPIRGRLSNEAEVLCLFIHFWLGGMSYMLLIVGLLRSPQYWRLALTVLSLIVLMTGSIVFLTSCAQFEARTRRVRTDREAKELND